MNWVFREQAEILKLWLTFQHPGREGVTQLIDEGYRLTATIHDRVVEHDTLELASKPDMNLVCFRTAPQWCPSDGQDELNSQVLRTLLSGREIFVSLPTHWGNRWLRVVLLNPFTNEETIDRLFDGINATLRTRQRE